MNRDEKEFSLEHFFSYAFDMFAILGTDGYFKLTNPAFQAITGYTCEELRSRPVLEFLHPEDIAKTKKGIQTLAGGNPTIASKNRYLCKDGTYRWFSWNTNSVGSLFYSVGRDITEQVKAEELIRNLNFELQRKNEDLEIKIQDRVNELKSINSQMQHLQKMDAIGRLAGGVAHDFNNMLAAISLYCDLMNDEVEPLVMQENVENIRKVTEKAAALTRQLLIFSRKQIVRSQNINLNPVLQQLEKMLTRLLGQNIQLLTKLSSDLRSINVDPSQMEQIILNLVINARDAISDSGKIIVETRNVYLDEAITSSRLSVDPGHYVLLSVSDNGHGMDEDTQSKIFEPFFTTKPVGKGTGLGLATVYGIVKQCGGGIWVYSEPGKGTTFKVYLPVSDLPADSVTLPEFIKRKISSSQVILLVEDDENLRIGFSTMLRKFGYKVLEAKDSTDALEICKGNHKALDLLLTDVVMPGDNGFELAKKAKEICRDIRVLYMSGYTDEALESFTDTTSLASEFIQKPFGANALISKVQEVLAKSRMAPTS